MEHRLFPLFEEDELLGFISIEMTEERPNTLEDVIVGTKKGAPVEGFPNHLDIVTAFSADASSYPFGCCRI